MKDNATLPCITALMLLFIIALCLHWKTVEQQSTYDKVSEDRLIEKVNTENMWDISYQKAARKGKYSQIDASDDYLFLAYPKNSCVDVYNHTGEFQYAIILPDCQNGSIRIRCEENYLFVRDKNNMVYVFDGKQEIERMDHSQATNKGYSFFWFEEKKSLQRTDGTVYIEIDQSGNVVKRILLPNEDRHINVMRVVILIIAVLVHLFFLLRYLILKKTTT